MSDWKKIKLEEKSYIFINGKVCDCKDEKYVLMNIDEDGDKKQVSVCTKCQGEVKGSLPELDAFFQQENT